MTATAPAPAEQPDATLPLPNTLAYGIAAVAVVGAALLPLALLAGGVSAGTLTLGSRPGHGTTVTLVLPIPGPAAPGPRTAARAGTPAESCARAPSHPLVGGSLP